MKTKHALFISEAELCAAFIDAATRCGTWRAYPETAGFDILMVRVADGAQIGIEAKLALNAKVLSQALPTYLAGHGADSRGPDFRAVLVPYGRTGDLSKVCEALGIIVLSQMLPDSDENRYRRELFRPDLPSGEEWRDRGWHDWCPSRRCKVPDYVPDVEAGRPAPIILSEWKVKAIKLAVLMETRPVTRSDFKALNLSPTIWTNPHGWLIKSADGRGYIPSPNMPDFRAQHPKNFEQIKADREKWEPKPVTGGLGL